MMFTPNRPWEMLSIVVAMRAAIGGGMGEHRAGREQLDARRHRSEPAMSVKDSRL